MQVPCHFVPNEDEYFFSICTRLESRVPFPSSNAFGKKLLGGSSLSWQLNRRAPDGMPTIAEAIHADLTELVLKHTLVPYYESVAQRPLDEAAFSRLFTAPHPNKRYRTNNWLRKPLCWCLDCIAVDIETCGEPYWHRSHQIPGVFVCLKHHSWLCHSCPSCRWEPGHSRVQYPPHQCTFGHRFASTRPPGAMSKQAEVTLAEWSSELLEWKPSQSGIGLTRALRKWIGNEDSCFDPRTTPLRFSSGVLGDVYKLAARVSNAPRSLYDILTSTSAFVIRPHPLEVLLGIKQAAGTDCHALHNVLAVRPERPDPTWKGRWEALGTNQTRARVDLLVELIQTEGPALRERGHEDIHAQLARLADRTPGWVGFWRKKSEQVDQALLELSAKDEHQP